MELRFEYHIIRGTFFLNLIRCHL